VDGLLQRLTTKSRLDRGRRISDDELSIDEVTDERITATIRDYMIDIDLKERMIVHDCEDWRKGLGIKRVCKHLCKLQRSLPLYKIFPRVGLIKPNRRREVVVFPLPLSSANVSMVAFDGRAKETSFTAVKYLLLNKLPIGKILVKFFTSSKLSNPA